MPWYTLHKLLAGLIDAYDASRYAPVLAAASALGDWVVRRALSWDKETRDRVLSVEYGGMNDCLYELYARTGNADYARAAHVFDEEPLFDAILSEGKDVLKDRHANTTIPKVLGALKRYVCLDGKSVDGGRVDATRYLRVAEVFFRMVVERHTYVTGGNSEWEHFGADYVLDAERTNCNCETCNVYNMLKLARLLFCVTGDKYYTDYYDNAFTNSVLSSQNPETGMTTYFQPMASGYFKVFSRPYDKFWCCTGSGMENFTKLGDSAAYVRGNDIYLEQYLSMRVEADARVLDVSCNFPMEEEAEIRIGCAPAPFVLYLRVPDWALYVYLLKRMAQDRLLNNRAGILPFLSHREIFCISSFPSGCVCTDCPIVRMSLRFPMAARCCRRISEQRTSRRPTTGGRCHHSRAADSFHGECLFPECRGGDRAPGALSRAAGRSVFAHGRRRSFCVRVALCALSGAVCRLSAFAGRCAQGGRKRARPDRRRSAGLRAVRDGRMAFASRGAYAFRDGARDKQTLSAGRMVFL